jgi:hypothetical protein
VSIPLIADEPGTLTSLAFFSAKAPCLVAFSYQKLPPSQQLLRQIPKSFFAVPDLVSLHGRGEMLEEGEILILFGIAWVHTKVIIRGKFRVAGLAFETAEP